MVCIHVSFCIYRLTFRRGQLLRKRNFTIVPYSSSHDLHQAARSPRSSDGPDFHIITNMSDRKVKLLLMIVMMTMVMMMMMMMMMMMSLNVCDRFYHPGISTRKERKCDEPIPTSP